MKMSATVFLLAMATTSAEPHKYARGFVRQPRTADEILPVASITDEMRRNAPDKLDWSEVGATSPVKNQGSCGSCWAYSATEGVESAVYMATKQMTPLSTQEIISCDKDEPDGGGCDGGDLPTAYAWLLKAGGMDSAVDYPDHSRVTGTTGKCTWDGKTIVAQLTNWTYAIKPCALSEQAKGGKCTNQDEDGLKAALATHGPLSVCVNAGSFDSYESGVLKGTCSGAWADLDHCVQLVGYDTTSSPPYWKVKNSWGASWGENGFIRLPMGENACGIADEATWVTAKPVAPTPGPSPSPPAPSPPGPPCADQMPASFCELCPAAGSCGTVASLCLKTCGCCDKNPPAYCPSAENIVV